MLLAKIVSTTSLFVNKLIYLVPVERKIRLQEPLSLQRTTFKIKSAQCSGRQSSGGSGSGSNWALLFRVIVYVSTIFGFSPRHVLTTTSTNVCAHVKAHHTKMTEIQVNGSS